jgi:hypothetical protein
MVPIGWEPAENRHMRLVQIRLFDFKGVDAELMLAPAMVLFGPNDTGKTNLLEAFEVVLGNRAFVREDPVDPGDLSDHFVMIQATCEVSGLDQLGSPDREFFQSGLSKGWFIPESDEWAEREEVYSVAQPPDSLEELMRPVAGSLVRWASDCCADWDAVKDDYWTVLEACLQSDLVQIDWEFAYWLAPNSSRWRGRQRRACEHLAATRDLWEDGWVPLIDPLLDRERLDEPYPFLGFGHSGERALDPVLRAVLPIRAVTADNAGGLSQEIESFVEEQTSIWMPIHTSFDTTEKKEPELVKMPRQYGSRPVDVWLQREGDQESVHPKIRAACSQLAGEATRIAPALVANEYEIVVRPLLASERVAFERRKIQVALNSRQSGRLFDLSVVGSGIRTWTQYSLQEAMRTLRRAGEEVVGSERRSIYVLDEPERHLHPSAQVDIARWLAERVRDGAQMLLATHALPFLDIPYEGTEYFRVFRDNEGMTRAARLTPDPVGRLDRVVKEAGLSSRAQLIQLTRAALIVEGEHDRVVIDRFFAKELRAARVRVLSLAGAKRAGGIPDLKLLQDLDVPLFLLFDNVSARSLGKPKENRSDSLEVREIKLLLNAWPEDRRRPVVLPFDLPDIICALPNEAVDQVMRQTTGSRTGFSGWGPLIAEYRVLHVRERRGFKDFAGTRTGLIFDLQTIRRILGRSPSVLPGDSPLYKPIQQMLANLS